MQIIINGESKTVTGPKTVSELLVEMEIDGRIAVEVNNEILPRSQFSDHQINNGDILEIVHAIGGG